MALTPNEIGQQYPLPIYNFRVVIGTQTVGFSEVSGLNVEYEKIIYRHGLGFLEGESILTFRYDRWIPIIFKKGMVRGQSFLHDWFHGRVNPRMPILVQLCDQDGNPTIQWRIEKATPIKLEGPTFDTNSNEVAIESMEISAAGLKIEYL